MENKYIYHFTRYENLKSILESDILRITSIENMNDVNESTIQYPKSMINVSSNTINNLIDEYNRVNGYDKEPYKAHIQAKKEVSEVYKNLYSLSFVELKNEKDKIEDCELLWAHYGDCHRGAAIKFNKKKLNKLLEEQFYLKSVKQNIKYVTKENLKIAIIKTFEDLMQFKIRKISKENFLKRSNYFYKLKCWDYEQEYRFLVYSSEYESKDNYKYLELKNIKSAIESISIGYNANYENYRRICMDNDLGSIFPKKCYSIWGEDSPLDIIDITLEKFKGIKLEKVEFPLINESSGKN